MCIRANNTCICIYTHTKHVKCIHRTCTRALRVHTLHTTREVCTISVSVTNLCTAPGSVRSHQVACAGPPRWRRSGGPVTGFSPCRDTPHSLVKQLFRRTRVRGGALLAQGLFGCHALDGGPESHDGKADRTQEQARCSRRSRPVATSTSHRRSLWAMGVWPTGSRGPGQSSGAIGTGGSSTPGCVSSKSPQQHDSSNSKGVVLSLASRCFWRAEELLFSPEC